MMSESAKAAFKIQRATFRSQRNSGKISQKEYERRVKSHRSLWHFTTLD